MADDKLANYIKKQLTRGFSLDQIKTALLKTGYKMEDVKEALNKTGSGKIAGRPSNIKKIPFVGAIAVTTILLAIILIISSQNIQKKPESSIMADEKDFSDCINKLENIADVWSDDGFREIYFNPDDSNKIKDFKELAFGILRTVCEGNISFRIINVTVIAKDEFNAKINMYCNGAVDFTKLGKNYENAVRKEAKPDNLIDRADIFLIKKGDACLLKNFNY
ncbi:hypothetical protein HYU07_00255 [Candidatus Woesearchaeota archaeon]|nr:hypothetical protein [Candidatus Woesearchaeota archaeon]